MQIKESDGGKSMSSLRVVPIQVAGQQTQFGKPFPLVLQCQSGDATLESSAAWVTENRRKLLDQSAEHGAILFRGFPLKTAEDFDRFVTAFDLPNFAYDESLSNAVRVN